MKKITTYIDESTGEILNEKERFVDVKFDEAKGYLFWNKKTFNRCWHGVKLPDAFTYAEKGHIFDLQSYVWSTTNLLAYKTRTTVVPMDEREICEAMGMSERQGNILIEKMIADGVLGRIKIKHASGDSIQYYLSPIYFCSTNRIPLNLYLLFREQLNKVLPGWVIERFAKLAEEEESMQKQVSQG